jgi:hypothetical protein
MCCRMLLVGALAACQALLCARRSTAVPLLQLDPNCECVTKHSPEPRKARIYRLHSSKTKFELGRRQLVLELRVRQPVVLLNPEHPAVCPVRELEVKVDEGALLVCRRLLERAAVLVAPEPLARALVEPARARVSGFQFLLGMCYALTSARME